MRFKPGRNVTLYFDDGATVHARPFYSVGTSRRAGIVVQFITDAGDFIDRVQGADDVYTLGDTGKLLYLEPPHGVR